MLLRLLQSTRTETKDKLNKPMFPVHHIALQALAFCLSKVPKEPTTLQNIQNFHNNLIKKKPSKQHT